MITDRSPGGTMQSTSPDRPDYDHALKRLFLDARDGVLALFAPGVTWVGALNSDLPGSNRQADIVWHVKQLNGEPGVFHIELQSTRDDEMGQRVADYALRLHIEHELPVHSIVIYLRPDGSIPDSTFGWDWGGRPSFRYEYEIVRLWEWRSEQVLTTPYYNLWPLAGFMQDVTVDTTADIADRIVATAPSEEEREQLTGDLALFAGMRLPWEAIYQAIRRQPMLKDLWEQSSLGKALEVI